MEELSFFEKLVVLYENIIDHPLFVLLFFVPIILFLLQKKHGKKVFIIVYFIVIIAILSIFGDIVFKLFDNLMDGLFMFLYFPNFITLFGVVVACSLIALVSLFSKNINKVSKIINYVSFGIVQSLFALILITVRVNKVNIYKDNALYTNKDILTLMQFLIGVFAIQVLSITIIKLINKATMVLDGKANITSSVNKQVVSLSKSKIKPVNIDNNRVGYINVADKSVTSKPRLKPFKFDINKLESINFSEYLFPSKGYSAFNLANKDVSYYNEIVPKKLFNKVDIDYNKYLNINVPDKPYKSFKLGNKDFSYLNEIVKVRKFKPALIDSSKFVYLKTFNRGFKKVVLQNKVAHYLNEVIKVRKFRLADLDSNKIIHLNVPKKSFNILSLDDKNFSYLNENVKNYNVIDIDYDKNVLMNVPSRSYNISSMDKDKNVYLDVPKRSYIISSIDNDKDINVDVPSRGYSSVSLNNKDFKYLNEIADTKSDLNMNEEFNSDEVFSFEKDLFKEKDNSFDYNEIKNPVSIKEEASEYDKMFNSKPILETSEKNNVVLPIFTLPRVVVKSEKLVDNLKIVDIQSVLDVIVKCHLMKDVVLKSDSKMTVKNLEICNFKLLASVIKIYKLIKK